MKKIQFKKYKDLKYVFISKPRYRLANGKLSKDLRTYYGKIVNEHFIPNKTYLNLSEKEKLELGLESNPQESPIEKAVRESRALDNNYKSFGGVYLLQQAASKSGVVKVLKSCFPERYKKILSISYFLILSQNKRFSYFEEWANNHQLPANIDGQLSEDFIQSISKSEKKFFFLKWANSASNKTFLPEKSELSYSQLLKLGSENNVLTGLNYFLGFNVKNHLPVYIKKLDNRNFDNKPLDDFLSDLRVYGIANPTLFLDKDHYDKKYIKSLIENKYNFLAAIEGSPVYVKNLFKNVPNIELPQYYIRRYNKYAITRKYIYQYEVDNVKKGRTVYVTKYYDVRTKNSLKRFK